MLALGLMMILTGCSATAISSVCPPLIEYDRATLTRAADDLKLLPAGSPVRELIKDYKMTRDQLRACHP